jgi:hypothetical protein
MRNPTPPIRGTRKIKVWLQLEEPATIGYNPGAVGPVIESNRGFLNVVPALQDMMVGKHEIGADQSRSPSKSMTTPS